MIVSVATFLFQAIVGAVAFVAGRRLLRLSGAPQRRYKKGALVSYVVGVVVGIAVVVVLSSLTGEGETVAIQPGRALYVLAASLVGFWLMMCFAAGIPRDDDVDRFLDEKYVISPVGAPPVFAVILSLPTFWLVAYSLNSTVRLERGELSLPRAAGLLTVRIPTSDIRRVRVEERASGRVIVMELPEGETWSSFADSRFVNVSSPDEFAERLGAR